MPGKHKFNFMDVRYYLSLLGPGIAVAATGVGAGDMVAAAVVGSKYGLAVVWASANWRAI